MLDLDGVVYRGREAIDGVPSVLGRAKSAGMTLAFVTNNAARPAASVAEHLRDLGVPASEADVVTSAQAAAREVAKCVKAGAPVLVVGGEGLEVALRERGLVPVASLDDHPQAVVQGFHPDVGWRQLAQAAYGLATGIPWVASNLDLSIPTAAGIAPGNGTLVNAVAAAVNRRPDVVAGKPFRPLFDETVLRVGARKPLIVGDRLDTDVEGAVTVGVDSLLVMTGVTDLGALCAAKAAQRPSYVSWRLDGLLKDHPEPQQDGTDWRVGNWTARAEDHALTLVDTGKDRDDGLRAVVAAAWEWYDGHPDAESGALDLATAADAVSNGAD